MLYDFVVREPNIELILKTQAIEANMSGSTIISARCWQLTTETHHWQSDGLPAEVTLEWEKPVSLSKVEINCDTNVRRNIMMREDSKVSETYWNAVPPELLKSLDIEARIQGRWVRVGANQANRTRLIKFRFDRVQASAVRTQMTETYGHPNVKLFEIRCYER